jgi:NADH dehydrogenase
MKNGTERKKPQVVIIGAGFGGLNAAKALRRAPVDVLLVDKNNYHLFQPLLYQVATSGLAPDQIAYPVRAIFRNQKNFNFHLAEVSRIDLESRQVHTSSGQIHYDFLILAPGGETNYYGLDSVARNGFTLKDLQDSEAIRNHILRMFELADQAETEQAKQALRTILVAGGGPTGVECAGAISELIRLVLKKDFPAMDFSNTTVILLEAMDRLLAGFPEELGESAAETLREKHVQVRFGAAVADYDGRQVRLKDGQSIEACTLIWAAGVKASSLLDPLPVAKGRQGRVVVEPTLQVPGYPEVFVIGDAAYMESDGQPLPMMAPVAIQQAKLAARNIRSSLESSPLRTFKYKDPGSLATIGRNAAVARLGQFKFHGFLAWLLWLAVHIFWLIGFRNRLLVLINWASDYLFYERGVRLITAPTGAAERLAAHRDGHEAEMVEERGRVI